MSSILWENSYNLSMIGKRIKELRLELKISQETLAEAIKVHASAVSLWESEKTEPKASYIVSLAKYFNVTSDYLLGLSDD